MDQNNVKHCPLNHTNCIEHRCKFWMEITRVDPSPVQGVNKTSVVYECGILLAVSILGQIANRPPVIMAPPARPHIMGG